MTQSILLGMSSRVEIKTHKLKENENKVVNIHIPNTEIFIFIHIFPFYFRAYNQFNISRLQSLCWSEMKWMGSIISIMDFHLFISSFHSFRAILFTVFILVFIILIFWFIIIILSSFFFVWYVQSSAECRNKSTFNLNHSDEITKQ